jgi:hypothetical protein
MPIDDELDNLTAAEVTVKKETVVSEETIDDFLDDTDLSETTKKQIKLLRLTEQNPYSIKSVAIDRIFLNDYGLKGNVNVGLGVEYNVEDINVVVSALKSGKLSLREVTIWASDKQDINEKGIMYGNTNYVFCKEERNNYCKSCNKYKNACELSPYVELIEDDMDFL